MIDEKILEKVNGDEELASFISTFWSAYTDAEPFVDKLEDALREEFRKSNPGPQALFAILAMFSGRMLTLFRKVLQMNDKDIKEAYNLVFQTCYDTYAHSQDEKLQKINLSWDEVKSKIEELEREIRATEHASNIIKENMKTDPENYNTKHYKEHLGILTKQIETLKEYKRLLKKNFPTEFN
jgi:hypothetical protein